MIKVLRYGNEIAVRNPQTGEETELTVVVFVEEGRSGGDQKMSETSAFLSQLAGEQVGLSSLRTHSHPVRSDKLDKFPIDEEYPGLHINRGLFSTPQMRQQEQVDPRMIDGRPTYFKTWIDTKPEDDVDFRVDNNVLLSADPTALLNSRVGSTEVRTIGKGSSAQQTSKERIETVGS